jgi:hypothetical protein
MNREEEYNKKYGEHLIGKAGDYICGRCKEIWEPTDVDINRKAMMTYYKCCGGCREYLYNREVARKAKLFN